MGPGECNCFPHKGHLDFLDNQVDPTTGTIQMRAVFPNSEAKLLPGMFVRVRIPIEKLDNALLVPDEALGADQGGRYLLVVDDQNKVHKRTVTVGPLQDDQRVILAGIKAEDRVVVQGVQRARPGIKVTPREAQAKPAESAGAGGKDGGKP